MDDQKSVAETTKVEEASPVIQEETEKIMSSKEVLH